VSWYYIVLFLLLFGQESSALSQTQKPDMSESMQVMRGVLYENAKAYTRAYEQFLQLYEKSYNEVYLHRAGVMLLKSGKDFHPFLARIRPYWRMRQMGYDLEKLYLWLLLKSQAYDEAREVVDDFRTKIQSEADVEIVVNAYLYLDAYDEAYRLLKDFYAKEGKASYLRLMLLVLARESGHEEESLQLLETHYRLHGFEDERLFKALVEASLKQGKLSRVIELYRKRYLQNHHKDDLEAFVGYSLLAHQVKESIAFVEKEAKQSTLLYTLYEIDKQYKRVEAYMLQRYKETSNAEWLVKKAMVQYHALEGKREDKEALESIFTTLEKAYALGQRGGAFVNFYGYLLIDFNRDIPKGIALVKEALKKEPQNAFYLDSLAWGLYGLKKCQEAQEVMQRVKALIGLDDPEIRYHFEEIQKCH